MRKAAPLAVLALLALAVPASADAAPYLTVARARAAIHHADAYAIVGRCRHTRSSVVCGVTHEIETRDESGTVTAATIRLTDRVYWGRHRVLVSTIWEGPVTVPV